MPHPHDGDDAQTPEEHVAVANAALAEGDLAHAILHAATALSYAPLDPDRLALVDRVCAASDDPAALVPFTPGLSFALVAVRAELLARRGELTEALDWLFQVAKVRPELPYLGWAPRWLAAGGAIDPVRLERPIGAFVIGTDEFDDEVRPAVLQAALPALSALAARCPDRPEVRYWYGAALRRLGRLPEALAEVEGLYAAAGGSRAALAVAMVRRELGEIEGAKQMFEVMLELEPTQIGARLDLGDMLCDAGRIDEGLRYYLEVLELEPDNAWARPSVHWYRFVRDQGEADAEALRLLTFNDPDNRRAAALAERLPKRRRTRRRP